ncbi:protein COFACTOR ASSEMBLY OF COMPLEX C SUBUNIT B CCB2, chloroplastic isoform X2 [Rhododendron vialii]|uniref:protein COFACTOR ASSEMBLY OF COMPLEX C SUBUNIT B CCB2, chloroplastic isoform X2 n=1 Tax=Rhododendron vialii TaxID=182163 RepID=UPI00265EDFB3|nr:protein COFACTOR ASSEMBLY OF COMPLEX C SUBUNIT B CCB2, chloroplastic isoform X2 [Rhododendron vialii]
MSRSLFLNPLLPFEIRSNRKLSTISCTGLDNSQNTTSDERQLNLSVLRFTFGIPGLDESYLPRWIGYAFGSLLLLNHFAGSNSTTPAQLRSEALGLSLAGFSIVLPYLGKFLKSIAENVKEDLAWGTYVLLRNTNSISVLILVQGALCVRGYWNTPRDVSKVDALGWFQKQIQQIGFSDLKDTLYFPQCADSEIWEILPKGTRSIIVQPVCQAPKGDADQEEKNEGFVLLASSMSYAYSNKDTAWIGAVANKFRGISIFAEQ